jgi:putative transposase
MGDPSVRPEGRGYTPYNPKKHHRRSIRLRNYDYSQTGVYFITLCTQNRECLFGEIIVGANGVLPKMILNEYGMIARDEWIKSAAIRFEIELDEFVVMPNHFHGIIVIHGRGDRPVAPTKHRPGPQPKSIGALVAGFKSAVTKRINQIRKTPGIPVWQRNYYDHIIRVENELNCICEYIRYNPMRWEEDEYYGRA